MENSSSESDSESDEDLAVLELIDASSDDEKDDEEDEEEEVKKNLVTETQHKPDARIDRPLSELVEENVKVKQYPNTMGGTFITGVDVLSKDAKQKREKRAERFGITKEEQKSGTGGDIQDIASVMLPPGSKIDGSTVRLEALHISGVDDMSTKDIFSYFRDYMPAAVEWINDTSCNVVWMDPPSAARALAGMSRARQQDPPSVEEESASKSSHATADSDTEPMEEDNEEDILDLISNKETGETERVPKSPQSSSLPADTLNTDSMQSRPDSDMSEQAMECLEMVEADMRPVEVKSKDICRIGKSHPKADELLLRFACKDDKKQKGAYKHSQYYLKYGNPTFGGYKGLVSQSKRRHFRDGKYQPPVSTRRKRRYEYEEEEEREESEDLYPRKRVDQKERENESRSRKLDLRERLNKASSQRTSSGSDGAEGGEEEEDEDAEDLDAELRHALGSSPKRSMQMYADEVEAELKKLREGADSQEPLYKVRDARESLKGRLSVRDRLGHIRGAPTPASSLENLKIIVDTQDDISEKSSSEGEEETVPKSKGPLRQGDDLRAWLHNRETSRKLLENLPSLKIEVQDDT